MERTGVVDRQKAQLCIKRHGRWSDDVSISVSEKRKPWMRKATDEAGIDKTIYLVRRSYYSRRSYFSRMET